MPSGWDINSNVLTPCSSISTYGKIISSSGKTRPRKTQADRQELFIGMDDDQIDDPSAEARAELHTKETAPPKPGYQNSYWTTKGSSRPSPCFLNKGKPVDRNGRPEPTPGPSHYNPRDTLIRASRPSCLVAKPRSSKPKPRQTPSSTPAPEASPTTATRTDRMRSTLQPWVKEPAAARPSSAFRAVERRPLHTGQTSEIGGALDMSTTRPRSACYVSMGSGISREQRNKFSRGGVPGQYTAHLDYNKHSNNDLPMRARAASPIKMIQMVARKPLDDRETILDKTPGMHKLGRPPAAWGGADGSLGGTGEKLVRPSSSFARLERQSREQYSRTGHTPQSAPVDVMYDPAGVAKKPSSLVDYPNMQPRSTVMTQKTEGADEMYNWTKPLDTHPVPVPAFATTPTREQRKKVGYGSHSDPPSSVIADPVKLMHTISARVPGVQIGKMTSREPPSLIAPMKYKEQLGGDGGLKAIGDLSSSPVKGSAPLVPTLSKMSKREICKKEEKRRGDPRFG